MCIASQDLLKTHKILLCFRKMTKTMPEDIHQITHQISIRSLSKAQYFFVLLADGDTYSFYFIDSSHDTE